MNTTEKKLITRLVDLVKVYREPTIEEYLDEMFQHHLECTSMDGNRLSDGYYLLVQIKQIFKEAEQLTNVRTS